MNHRSILHLWVLPNNGFGTIHGLEPHAGGFMRKNPKTEVRVTVKSASSLWNSLFLMLKRPEEFNQMQPPPDLIQIPSHWTATLAHWGILEEMPDNFMELTGIVEQLRSHCVMDGASRVFSWPWWMEVWVMYYRRDVLSRLGVQEGALLTWQDFISCCKRIAGDRRTSKSYFPVANSNPRESVSLADVAPGIWSRGGDFLSSDGGRTLVHRQEAFEGVGAYLELLDRGWMPLLRKSGLAAENFFDGRAVFQFAGRFYRRMAEGRMAPKIGVVSYPKTRDSVALVTAHHLAVVKGSEHVQQAWDLLRHLTLPDVAGRYAESIGAFGCGEDWHGVFKGFEETGEVFRRSFAHARLLPNRMLMATLEQIFDRNVERLIQKILRRQYREKDIRSELLQAAAEMDYVLEIQRGPVPVS